MKVLGVVVVIVAWLAIAEAYTFRDSAGVSVPEEQWYTQKLDHFNGQETRTWKQRYFVNDTFWNQRGPTAPPAPIFFQMGGEGAVSGIDVVLLQMVQYGIKHNALMVTLEHRFYGTSQPMPDLSIENLRYLSSEQALADAAEFLIWLRDVQYKSPDSPIITFGCSYPGALAAWFRLKYPHVTFASVASSAPVEATLDFFQYLDVVDKSLEYFVGDQCVANIQKATTTISQMLDSSDGRDKLASMFRFCSPLKNEYDVANFYSSLAGNWMGTVQYNDENGNAIDIIYLCKMMTRGTDPLAAYVSVSNLFLGAQQQTCLDVSYADSIAQLRDTAASPDGVGIRQWVYQTCVEFGYFQTSDSTNQPFGNGMPLQFSLDQCRDAYGLINPPNVNATNQIYGGRNLPAWGPSNILFVNGNIDPWHALGVTKTISPTLTALLINGTAHCANVLPARADDPPSLVQARASIQAQIDKWVAQAQSKKKM